MSALRIISRRGGPLLGYQSLSGFFAAGNHSSITGLLSSDPSASSSSSSSSSCFCNGRRGQVFHISQLIRSNGKRAFLVDTLALVRKLEAQGVPSTHAEAITLAITEVLNDSLENVAQSFVSKGDMQKSEMIQGSNLSKFQSGVQSSQCPWNTGAPFFFVAKGD